MSTPSFARTFGAGVIFGLIFSTAVVRADPASRPQNAADPQAAKLVEARARFTRALELYRDGDLPSALAEFRHADALAPSYRLKYNIGQVCEEQHDYACALSAFQSYLEGGGSEIARARRTSVELEIQKVAASVAELNITVDVAGAEVLIDDVSVGTTPVSSPVRVNSGRRRITARQAGLVTTRSIEVAGGQQLNVALALRAAAPLASAMPNAPLASNAAAEPAPAAGTGSSRQLVWASWIATGVFASATAITGVVALHASHELADQRATVPTTRDTLNASSARVSHLALAADILGLLTAGSAACAVHFSVASGESGARLEAAFLAVSGGF